MNEERERFELVRPESGGAVFLDVMNDGRIALSVIAPQGHSVAVYLTRPECGRLAAGLRDLLARARPEPQEGSGQAVNTE